MQDLRRWQSLLQHCKDTLQISFELEDSIRLQLQLVQALESEFTSMKITNLRLRQEETSLINQKEELV